ncbi:hypothetical protein PQX77_004466 [Marasmius sp. AFHP31]|nr:hypothetical protein PQX77_004466 [Marasmius sp. AFHP31]
MPKASSPNASPVDVETPPHLDAASALLNDIQNASRMATPETPPVGGNYPKARPPRGRQTASAMTYTRPKYRLHCHSTRHNTIASFTAPDGSTIANFSGGSCGFKRGARSGYEAGYQCSVRVFDRIREQEAKVGPMYVELFFKGFGQGREAMQKALLTAEGDGVRQLIISVTDRTPLKIGGTRAKKARRL